MCRGRLSRCCFSREAEVSLSATVDLIGIDVDAIVWADGERLEGLGGQECFDALRASADVAGRQIDVGPDAPSAIVGPTRFPAHEFIE